MPRSPLYARASFVVDLGAGSERRGSTYPHDCSSAPTGNRSSDRFVASSSAALLIVFVGKTAFSAFVDASNNELFFFLSIIITLNYCCAR